MLIVDTIDSHPAVAFSPSPYKTFRSWVTIYPIPSVNIRPHRYYSLIFKHPASPMTPPDSTQSTLEHDPFVIGLKQRLPEELRDSFSDEQLRGLRSALATRSWARHKLDLRGTFSLWRTQYYFVVIGGRNKRNLSRAQEKLSMAAKAGAITLFLFFSALLGFVALYVLKSALGIDLLPNHSLGLWDWFKGNR